MSDSMQQENSGKERGGAKKVFREMLPYIIVLTIVILLRVFILINAKIPSESMETTIMTHTRVMGLKTSYWFSEPKRGDIIIFDAPDEPGTAYIKRVIAIAGDTIEVNNGKVILNGVTLDEPYLPEAMAEDGYVFGPVTVPDHCVFCMGDNRNHSFDARFWNNTWVSEDKIMGKVYFQYWPKFKWLADTAGNTFTQFETETSG